MTLIVNQHDVCVISLHDLLATCIGQAPKEAEEVHAPFSHVTHSDLQLTLQAMAHF